MPDLRRDVDRVVAGRDTQRREVRRRPCAARLPIGSMPSSVELDVRLLDRPDEQPLPTFCRSRVSPFSVGNTRSVGCLNGLRSSHTASSSRRAGVRSTTRTPASVFDCSTVSVPRARLTWRRSQVERLLDAKAGTRQRRQQRPTRGLRGRLSLASQQRRHLLRLHEPAAWPLRLQPASPPASRVPRDQAVLDGDLQDLREPRDRLVRRVRRQTARHVACHQPPAGRRARRARAPCAACIGRPPAP